MAAPGPHKVGAPTQVCTRYIRIAGCRPMSNKIAKGEAFHQPFTHTHRLASETSRSGRISDMRGLISDRFPLSFMLKKDNNMLSFHGFT